jgi:FAD/FMN-containing dehydrogenase
MVSSHERALREIEEVFGDRLKRGPARPGAGDALGSVSPMSAEEVELLAEVAGRYSVPLVALGAGTASAPGSESGGGILVHFDLMRGLQLPEREEPWVEAEPGASWLQLDDHLRTRGWGLAVYPTSAPRATVGGWLTQDGLGVGSFEYGWLSENILSASVVLPGGERREVPGEDLRSLIGPEREGAIVVEAKLRTRRADADVPFGATFGSADQLVGAVVDAAEARLPLWHLAFLNPRMAHARGLAEDYTLFGAYDAGGRAAEAEADLRGVFESHRGHALPAAEAHRAWGERFFPVAPSHPTPSSTRELVHLSGLPGALVGAESRPPRAAVQGTVARSGEVLLLSINAREEHREQ